MAVIQRKRYEGFKNAIEQGKKVEFQRVYTVEGEYVKTFINGEKTVTLHSIEADTLLYKLKEIVCLSPINHIEWIGNGNTKALIVQR